MSRQWLKSFAIAGSTILVALAFVVVFDALREREPGDPYAGLGGDLPAAKQQEYLGELKRVEVELNNKPTDYGFLMNQGFYRMHLGDKQGAIRAYIRAGEVSPANFLSFHNLGQLYVEEGQYRKAEQVFITALVNDPMKTYLYRNLIDLYNQRLPEKKSMIPQQLKTGLDIPEMSKNVELMALLAQYYEDNGDTREARKWYKKILTIEPKDEAGLEGLKRLGL